MVVPEAMAPLNSVVALVDIGLAGGYGVTSSDLYALANNEVAFAMNVTYNQANQTTWHLLLTDLGLLDQADKNVLDERHTEHCDDGEPVQLFVLVVLEHRHRLALEDGEALADRLKMVVIRGAHPDVAGPKSAIQHTADDGAGHVTGADE